jgi:hypothetical protein
VNWNTRYRREQLAARDALLASTASVTPVLSHFSNWLMAALGAAFALFIANLDTVLRHIGHNSFRWALLWFCASLLFGLVARWLSVGVIAGLAANSITPSVPMNILAFVRFYSSGLLLPYRCRFWHAFRAAKSGDLLIGAKYTAKRSQWQKPSRARSNIVRHNFS